MSMLGDIIEAIYGGSRCLVLPGYCKNREGLSELTMEGREDRQFIHQLPILVEDLILRGIDSLKLP
jgi:hypothetical protein